MKISPRNFKIIFREKQLLNFTFYYSYCRILWFHAKVQKAELSFGSNSFNLNLKKKTCESERKFWRQNHKLHLIKKDNFSSSCKTSLQAKKPNRQPQNFYIYIYIYIYIEREIDR